MALALVTTFLGDVNVGAAQTCASTQASWPNSPSWYGSSDVIYVYIKSDFASDMRGCSSNTDDDTELTQTKAEMAIQSAMEMWNQGSLGTALIYGGQTSASFATVCSSGSYEKPAVYVEFVAGCQDIEPPAGCDGDDAVASVFDDAGCSNVVHLQVYGADDTGSPTSCATGELSWDLGDTIFMGGTLDFKSNLVHEFGHVLNLGHPSVDAVMGQGHSYVSFRHLYGWDQDCADDNSSGRIIDHYARGRSTTGSWQSVVAVTSNTGKRGNYSGGFLMNGSSTERYLWYFDSEVRYSPVGSDGLFTFGSWNALTSSLTNLLVSPVVSSALEFSSGSYKDNRIGYMSAYSGSLAPYVRYARHNASTTGSFGTSVTTDIYEACTTTACTSSASLRSHIPMITAWDEHTGTTVFARVITSRDPSTDGKILLYPGFYNAGDGNEYLLRAYNELTSATPSESYDLWNYSNKTDHPVGLACAPDQDDLDYNCLLIWNDRGVPDGSVLYQYFQVDTGGGDINWRSSASSKLTGAYAIGGVSAAFFEGKFWISFKSGIDPFHDVYTAYTTSSSGYTSWSTPISLGRFNIVDPPTWYYVPHQTHEAALSWTEAHTQP